MTFDVTPSAAHGQVIRDPRDDQFLRYQDGTPYYPMGHNVAFQQGEPVGNDGEHYVEPLFASMEAAGQNWTRIWMTDFNRNALEWYARSLGGLVHGRRAVRRPVGLPDRAPARRRRASMASRSSSS